MSLYRHYAPVIDWTEKKTKSVKYKKAEVNQYRGVSTTTDYFIHVLRGGNDGENVENYK